MSIQNELRANEWARVQAYFDSKGQKTGLLQSNQGMGDESVMDPIRAGNAEGKYRQHEYMMVKGQLLRFEIPTEGERPNTFDAFAQDGTKYTITVEKVDRADLNTNLSKAMRAQFTTFKDEVKADLNTAEMIFSFSTPFAVESQNSVGGKSYEYFKIERNTPVEESTELKSERIIREARSRQDTPNISIEYLNKKSARLDKELEQEMAKLDELRERSKQREQINPVKKVEADIPHSAPTDNFTPPDLLPMKRKKAVEQSQPKENISTWKSGQATLAPKVEVPKEVENRGIEETVEKLGFFQRIRNAINNTISRFFPSPSERRFNEFVRKLENQANNAREKAKLKLNDSNLTGTNRTKYETEAKIKWYFEVADLKILKAYREDTSQLKATDRFKNRIESMFKEVQSNKYLIREFNGLDISPPSVNELQMPANESAGTSRKSMIVSYPPSQPKSQNVSNESPSDSQDPQKNVDPRSSGRNSPK